MSGFSVAKLAADAVNRHGKLTGRLVENGLAVEIRHADTGEHLTTLWAPNELGQWAWPLTPDSTHHRTMPQKTPLDMLIPAVATSVLDEGAKR
ncbi:hypothetical protein [Kribbella catacumbae]|uniref:hypothetical protein n=1 Tax=Kribbella catacumbae TaxID=460086 RepID=UPI000380E1BF|nr:hypothetical protein [Kribbella catacumbae]